MKTKLSLIDNYFFYHLFNMITNIDNNYIYFTDNDKQYTIDNQGFYKEIYDIIEYKLHELIKIIYDVDDKKILSINDNLVIFDQKLLYNDSNIPNKEITIKHKFSFGFRNICIRHKIVEINLNPFKTNSGILYYTQDGTVIKNKSLISIIEKMTDDEKNKLIEIFKQCNFGWLQKNYKLKNIDLDYKLILDTNYIYCSDEFEFNNNFSF